MLRKVTLYSTAGRRKSRLFGCAACRRIWELLNAHCREAVEASEQYADGSIAEKELDRLSRAVAEELGDIARDELEANVARAAFNSSSLSLASPLLAEALNAIIRAVPDGEVDEQTAQVVLVRDIFGNPFRPASFSPSWRTDAALSLARQMYESRDFGAMPILADALQEAGCDSEGILSHCRDASATHVRGCWVVDLVLDKT